MAAAKSLISKIVTLEEGEVVEPIRLGKVGGNRPRLLKVTVKNHDKKKEIVRKAPELNRNVADKDKRVYINHDYTQKQREKYKALREEKWRRTREGEQNLVIRNGKIVVFKPGGGGQQQSGVGATASSEADSAKQ